MKGQNQLSREQSFIKMCIVQKHQKYNFEHFMVKFTFFICFCLSRMLSQELYQFGGFFIIILLLFCLEFVYASAYKLYHINKTIKNPYNYHCVNEYV